MKSRSFLIIATAMLLPMLIAAQSPVFSVRVGPIIQSSQLGLDMGSIQPYVGVDYLSMGFDATLKNMFYAGEDSMNLILIEQEKNEYRRLCQNVDAACWCALLSEQ